MLLLLATVWAFAGDGDNEPAPRFRAKTLTGENFNNESVKGKVVLLEFWTTWCSYCRDEEALVEKIYKEFANKGLLVLAIDVAESQKDSQEISGAASACLPHRAHRGHESGRYVPRPLPILSTW